MKQLVTFNSPEYACFHEAGHAVAAHSVGATVVEMELCRESPRSYGRTLANRTEAQASCIALGGFAAEYLLYKLGRLVMQDGKKPSEKEFIDYAYRNAEDDFDQFWRYAAGSCDPGVLGISQKLMDKEFIENAVQFAESCMPLDVIERVASALLAAGTLGEEDVNRAIAQKNEQIDHHREAPNP